MPSLRVVVVLKMGSLSRTCLVEIAAVSSRPGCWCRTPYLPTSLPETVQPASETERKRQAALPCQLGRPNRALHQAAPHSDKKHLENSVEKF